MSDIEPDKKQPDSGSGGKAPDSVVPADIVAPKCPDATNPVASSPCLLDSDADFNPDYLPDYSKGSK